MFTSENWYKINKAILLRAQAFQRVFFVLVLSSIGIVEANAQRDVIITQAGEEIRCRILDETPTRFIYAYLGPKDKILRTEIFKNLVSNFQYNKYDTDLVVISFDEKKKKKKNRKRKTAATNATLEDSEAVVTTRKERKKAEPVAEKTEPVEIEDDADVQVPALANTDLLKEIKADEAKITEDTVSIVAASLDSSSVETVEENVSAKVIENNTVPSDEAEIMEDTVSMAATPLESSSEETKETENDVVPALETVEDNIAEQAIENSITPEEVREQSDEEVKSLVTNENAIATELEDTKEEEFVKTEEPIAREVTTSVLEDNSSKQKGEFNNYLKWRVGVKAGIGNIRDKGFEATNEFGLYQEKLLKGWTFGADLAFFPIENFGLGLVYTDFKSSNSSDNITYINELNGAETTGSISNALSRKFIGPSIFLRRSIDFKTFVVLGLSPGVYFYSNEGNYNGANFKFTGQDFGGGATLGLDFLLGNDIVGRDIILSLEAGYNIGKLNEINYSDGTGDVLLDSPITLERLDFSIGLRFMRFPRYLKK